MYVQYFILNSTILNESKAAVDLRTHVCIRMFKYFRIVVNHMHDFQYCHIGFVDLKTVPSQE